MWPTILQKQDLYFQKMADSYFKSNKQRPKN
jgi:hypothetical protein